MHFFYPYVAFYGLKSKGRINRRRIVSKKAEIKDKKAEICLIIGLLAAQYADSIQVRIIKGDKDINFGSIYENAVAQELVAHGLEPYYYNSKKSREIDFVIENNGNNDNITVEGRITYVPVYIVMFLNKGDAASIEYRIDLGGLLNGNV